MDLSCFESATVREEAKILEQQGKKTKGLEISQDQILSGGHYSAPQDQALYNEHTCPYVAQQL